MKQKLLIIGIALLIFLLLGGIFISYMVTASKGKESLKLGNKYLEEGHYEEAIIAFENTIKIEPKNIEARIGLAKAYIGSGKNQEAEKTLKDAISIDEKKPDTYLVLAELYVDQGKSDEAISILEKAYERTKNKDIKKMLDKLKSELLLPTVSVPGGKYDKAQSVVLNKEGNEGTIYYTLDGTAPSKDSTKYEKPIEIGEGKTTLKAVVIFEDGVQSEEISYEYSIGLEPNATSTSPTEHQENSDYILPFSSTRLITSDDIKELTPKEIDYARNEIYARRGYQFNKQEYIDYFNKKSWYKPDPSFSEKNFNEFEKANVEFLLKYSESMVQDVDTNGSKNTTLTYELEIVETNKPFIGDESTGGSNNELWIHYSDGRKELLVASKYNDDPKKIICGISNARKSVDGAKVYFESRAYVTDNNIFVVDVKTKIVKWVCGGGYMRIVTKGEYIGSIIVCKREYLDEGGAAERYYIVDDNGNKLAKLSDADYKFYYEQ